jgi:pseudouridine kinase
VREVASAASAEYLAVLDPDGTLVLAVAAMDVLDHVDALDVETAIRSDAPQWVFLDCNVSPDVLKAAIDVARSAGALVAADAVSAPKSVRLTGLLAGLDVLFCNGDEAAALAAGSGHDAEVLTRRLLAAGARRVVLTAGERGAWVGENLGSSAAEPAVGQSAVGESAVGESAVGECVTWVPAQTASVVDVTGAGDALVAGTLAGLVGGKVLADAVRGGARLAALTVASRESVRNDTGPWSIEP